MIEVVVYRELWSVQNTEQTFETCYNQPHIHTCTLAFLFFFYTRLLCWAIACWRESEKIRRQQDIKQLRQQASPWQIRLFKLFKPWTSLARQLATWRPCRSHVTDISGGQSQAGLQAEEAGLKLSGRCDWLCVGRQKIPVWLHPTVGKGRNGQAKNCDFRRLGQWLEIFVVSAGQCEKIRQVINPVRDRWSDRNKTEAVGSVFSAALLSFVGPFSEARDYTVRSAREEKWWTCRAWCAPCSCAPSWCRASRR